MTESLAPRESKKDVSFTVRIIPSERSRLKLAAELLGIPERELVRTAIRYYLDSALPHSEVRRLTSDVGTIEAAKWGDPHHFNLTVAGTLLTRASLLDGGQAIIENALGCALDVFVEVVSAQVRKLTAQAPRERAARSAQQK